MSDQQRADLRPAVGAGLAPWAHQRPAASGRPRPRRLLLLPVRIALSLVGAAMEKLGTALMALFRIDDHGHVHVHDGLVAFFVGAVLALTLMAFHVVAVFAYDLGVAHGMQAAARAHWRSR